MHFDVQEKLLVEQSFRVLAADARGAAASFYRHLFRIRPDLRPLFVIDLDRQGEKLAQTLHVIVGQIDNWGLLRTTVEDLALRHVAYGVTPAHYEVIGQALLAMLRETLGTGASEATLRTWAKAYAAISEAMIAYAYPADQQESERD